MDASLGRQADKIGNLGIAVNGGRGQNQAKSERNLGLCAGRNSGASGKEFGFDSGFTES